ncbi:hypothetical protein [Streptococcus dysgalactiae]|uniref:Uncharacterized protein n=1 Tax=Streptococcus dysgalactiae subsp. equisimilis TaxID=119602 RepID=A0AAE9QW96_STREQ|nr:hypothetical protein [Streptococcus dysgalactiae]OBY96731.1 hypothetical protein BBG01_00725 [Streptococcus dysgalactiae subsp. equisimilis]SQB82548.1 Uncharacterised protein [Streptococcus dysgalactiae]VTT17735.1 Uncharacterised protein [Streptococcus dysgalactiae]VTT27469.1 Uncharacterised protein [Streptococcus dysgalactiae subsp. equisimilis]
MIPCVVINGIEPTVSHDSFGDFKRHEYHFPNGYGASVIHNPYSYGLELAVINDLDGKWELCYTSPIDDVCGYIGGEDELKELLIEIYNLPGDE